MKYCFTLFLLFSVLNLAANEISTPVLYKPQPYDVIEYNAVFEINSPQSKAVSAESQIKIYWKDKTAGSSFFFNLQDLSISSVLYNEVPIAFTKDSVQSGDYYYKVTPTNISEDTALVKITYSGVMTSEKGSNAWGGVHFQDSALFCLGVGMYNNYVSAARHWLACYDHPSDKALYDFTFIVPKEYKVSSCGDLIEEIEADETRKIFRWKGQHPAATYMLAFHIGKYETLEFNTDELANPVYVLSSQKNLAESGFKLLPEMLKFYSEKFGEYPFEKAGYTVTPIGSMEHQTMISLAKGALAVGDTFSSTVAHELSHQWFGGQVTPYDFRDAWLNESFATFSEALWAEHLYGKSGYLKELSAHISIYYSVLSSEGIIPIYDFPRGSGRSNYPATIYYKGSAVVSMLRWYLGDEVFFEAIQNYLAKYKHSNVNAQDLIDEFNTASGQDLDWFFQQWVFGKSFPQLTINGNFSKYNDNDLGFYQLTIEQVQNEIYGLYKALPVEITFKGKSGESFRRVFTLNEKRETFRIEDVEEIESISANTFETIRGLFRVNNITSDVKEVTKYEISASIESGILSIGGVNIDKINGVSLYSYQGKKYLSLDNYSSPINLSNLPKGVYFVVLHLNGEEIVKKISL